MINSFDKSLHSTKKKIEEIVNFYKKKLPVYLIKNQKNLGAYQNKLSLIKASKNEYIYILDSDNIAGKNFDKMEVFFSLKYIINKSALTTFA